MNASNQADLTIHGCGYRIENDRIIISVQYIANNRVEGNLSGTLKLQFCAYQQSDEDSDNIELAATTIGELKGQHYLSDCRYDLVYQQPPTGTWRLAIQLSEWNGINYTLRDSAYFDIPLNIHPISTPSAPPTNTIKGNVLQPVAPLTVQIGKKAKKSATNYIDEDGYLTINKAKVKRLLNVKGVPRKVLEKLISERPFQSNKAVLNIKGMGPIMLGKVLAELKY
ncbi:hypothetical protein C0J08_21885 [Marinomonas sp. CT5]|uniref:hypothetical protein n=1 Tax=Marinomonas sp. CT5 TaxID=2066133 RepID=UPI001BB0A832|nr:hypothetical protein [Marinomonas sp. CT5]QUX97899.1 hypothetical protein C0J08_21885 [Marinomonas sp. CT5]